MLRTSRSCFRLMHTLAKPSVGFPPEPDSKATASLIKISQQVHDVDRRSVPTWSNHLDSNSSPRRS